MRLGVNGSPACLEQLEEFGKGVAETVGLAGAGPATGAGSDCPCAKSTTKTAATNAATGTRRRKFPVQRDGSRLVGRTGSAARGKTEDGGAEGARGATLAGADRRRDTMTAATTATSTATGTTSSARRCHGDSPLMTSWEPVMTPAYGGRLATVTQDDIDDRPAHSGEMRRAVGCSPG